jgi:hypothetical protein
MNQYQNHTTSLVVLVYMPKNLDLCWLKRHESDVSTVQEYKRVESADIPATPTEVQECRLLGCDAVCLVRTDDSDECMASIIRVTIIGELGTTLAVTNN